MKLRWTESYVTKKPLEWRNQKRRELEQRLLVPISVYYAHGYWNFFPYLDAKQVQPVDAPTLEAQLLEQCGKNGKTFAKLHDNGWYFDELFAVALSLVRQQRAQPIVDRNGKFTAIKAV